MTALALAGCSGAAELETSRLFQEAQQLFNSAQTPEEYLRAAALYEQLISQGFVNGAVFFNLGNAYMQAGQRGRALAAYRQAKRYRPRDPYLDANLRYALGNRAHREKRSLLEHLLFWQGWLAYPEKFQATAGFAALTLVLALLALFRKERFLWRRLAVTALVVTILVGFSAGYDWYRYERTEQGVVIEDVTARKGNSETYEVAFTEPLNEGQEFRVVERRTDWVLIRLRGGAEGWIRQEAAVLY